MVPTTPENKRVKKSEKRKAIQKAQAVANAARGITDDLAELDMDNYDNDEYQTSY